MKKYIDFLTVRLGKAINVMLMAVPYYLTWYYFYRKRMAVPYGWKGNLTVAALFVVLYFFFCKLYDAFSVSYVRISDMLYSQSLSSLISDGIMYCVFCLILGAVANPLPLLACWAVQIPISAVWSTITHQLYFKFYSPRRTALIYDSGSSEQMEELIHSYGLAKKFNIVKIMTVEECIADLDAIRDMDTVFINRISGHQRNIIMKYCLYNSIGVFVVPRVGDVIMSGAQKMHMFHLPMLHVSRFIPTFTYFIIKRLFDIVASILALIVLSPMMVIVALLIHFGDGGPVFYKQDRVGKDGRIFKVYKFRSMKVDAEKNGVVVLSTGADDDRITPVGRVIRKYRIDELPQLLNIIKGDMSIVGPRPERPELTAIYEQTLPEFKLRTQVPAGLTGYAQVYGKYNTTPEDKLLMDLQYIAHPCISEDLRIIFATVRILFTPESTEGFSDERSKEIMKITSAQESHEE